nr:MAG TPA: hypothetical protein [Caudoviricetes sp.]
MGESKRLNRMLNILLFVNLAARCHGLAADFPVTFAGCAR